MDKKKVEKFLNKQFDKTNSLLEEKFSKFGDNLKKKITCDLGSLAHLVSRFACNTRVIVDASSNSPVSNVKSL